jgi:hypothetical protein
VLLAPFFALEDGFPNIGPDLVIKRVQRFGKLAIAVNGGRANLIFVRETLFGFWLGLILSPNLSVLIHSISIGYRLLFPIVALPPQIAFLLSRQVAASKLIIDDPVGSFLTARQGQQGNLKGEACEGNKGQVCCPHTHNHLKKEGSYHV